MKNKSKEELLNIIEDLQNKLEIAQNDVDYWQCEYNDMEKEKDKLERQVDDLTYSGGIKDLEHFMFELSKDGLDTEELKNFIGNYVVYKQ